VPDRYPDLKVILVHAGGFFPYQSGRILQWLNTSLGKGWQSDRAMSSVLSWFYYDTVAHSREVVEFLVERVGATQVLAGSDCPFAMADWSIFGEELALDLQPEARSAILGANAERIFPLGTAAR
jgi:aminocarboxymuconate-semialdehyde decarboxylase